MGAGNFGGALLTLIVITIICLFVGLVYDNVVVSTHAVTLSQDGYNTFVNLSWIIKLLPALAVISIVLNMMFNANTEALTGYSIGWGAYLVDAVISIGWVIFATVLTLVCDITIQPIFISILNAGTKATFTTPSWLGSLLFWIILAGTIVMIVRTFIATVILTGYANVNSGSSGGL